MSSTNAASAVVCFDPYDVIYGYITDTVGRTRSYAGWPQENTEFLVSTQHYLTGDFDFMRVWEVFEQYGSFEQCQLYANVLAQLLMH